ncbi:MAG: NTP transferase domain-containing protein [Deltaproteobacteria bacterium]|nr:NTP transferase domain-containing protein [Deltaproteobacteria bacterium]
MFELTAIVQARTSSKRLPRKVLLEYDGRTLLQHQLDRLRLSSIIDRVIVATSTDAGDDEIEEICVKEQIACVRGSLENVYSRFMAALHSFPSNHFLRYCADRPFFDLALLQEAWQLHLAGGFDITTNASLKTFPRGLTVELLRSGVFAAAAPEITEALDMEHVTSFFYRNKQRYRIRELVNGHGDQSGVNFCIDTPEDYERFKQAARKAGPSWKTAGWERMVEIFKELGFD